MEKMIYISTIFEIFISLYWLFSGLFFTKAKFLKERCQWCFIMSMISIFIFCFNWIFLTFSFHNLYKIITDPIEGIFKATIRLNIYLMLTILISAAVTILSYMAKIFGRSVNTLYNFSQCLPALSKQISIKQTNTSP